MRVHIVKVPPAFTLEGLDLRPLKLRPDETRNLRSPVAEVLLAWGYATKCVPSPGRPIKKRRRARRK
jgi:hypothetical protein